MIKTDPQLPKLV